MTLPPMARRTRLARAQVALMRAQKARSATAAEVATREAAQEEARKRAEDAPPPRFRPEFNPGAPEWATLDEDQRAKKLLLGRSHPVYTRPRATLIVVCCRIFRLHRGELAADSKGAAPSLAGAIADGYCRHAQQCGGNPAGCGGARDR